MKKNITEKNLSLEELLKQKKSQNELKNVSLAGIKADSVDTFQTRFNKTTGKNEIYWEKDEKRILDNEKEEESSSSSDSEDSSSEHNYLTEE